MPECVNIQVLMLKVREQKNSVCSKRSGMFPCECFIECLEGKVLESGVSSATTLFVFSAFSFSPKC